MSIGADVFYDIDSSQRCMQFHDNLTRTRGTMWRSQTHTLLIKQSAKMAEPLYNYLKSTNTFFPPLQLPNLSVRHEFLWLILKKEMGSEPRHYSVCVADAEAPD